MRSVGTKFFLVITTFALLFTGFQLYKTWTKTRANIEKLTAQQTALALEFDLAIREYVGDTIRPIMVDLIPENEFIPECMSTSFVARNVFEKVRTKFPDYIIKFSSSNPRNPVNQAGVEEESIIEYFRSHPNEERWVGKIQMEGKNYLAHFSARRSDKSCLHCHGQPQDAPASLVQRYGSKAAFGWTVGDVVALDTIAIPLDTVDKGLINDVSHQIPVMAASVFLLFGSLWLVFRKLVTKRLANISELFHHAAEQSDDQPIQPIPIFAQDEIGTLASSFNALASRLNALYSSLEQRVQVRTAELNREIANREKEQQERQRLEAQIQHAQKLESLGVLAGGIAHDFNNLLLGILGNANLALADIPPDSPSHKSLEQIEKAALRAAGLTEQMLAYSGRSRIVLEPINLGHLVKDMGNLLRVSISKKVTLDYQLQPELPCIEGDSSQIRQVVMNLITNASEAIGNQPGTVTLRVFSQFCHQKDLHDTYLDMDLAEGTYIILEVSDTGCGMDQETLDKIFDPFFTTKFTGRGLGLASVLGIVHSHNGGLNVKSESGQGTTFKVLFPASDKTANMESPFPTHSEIYEGRGQILVVDDERIIRSLSKRVLENAGFSVLLAEDGCEAVDLFKEHHETLSLVVLDMTMPRMDGAECFSHLSQINNTVPILFSSGYSETEMSEHFSSGEIAGFIKKPYRSQELLNLVKTILEGESNQTTQ